MVLITILTGTFPDMEETFMKIQRNFIVTYDVKNLYNYF